jgi:hypothetical protein
VVALRDRDLVGLRNYDRSLDYLLELANISGVILVFGQRQHFRRQMLRHAAAVFFSVFANKILCEGQNILPPFAQRQQVYGHDR